MTAGTITELWRYPVKSLGGERLDSAEVLEGGVLGDRLWAVRDDRTKTIAGGRQIPKLVRCTARYLEQPDRSSGFGSSPPVAIGLPDGTELRSDEEGVSDRLSDFLGQKVTLCARRPPSDTRHYRARKSTAEQMRREFAIEPGKPLPDFSMFPLAKLAQLARFQTPPGTYFDAYPLHVLSTASLDALEAAAPKSEFSPRRFRPNLLIELSAPDAELEAAWCGGTLVAGPLQVRIEIPTVRCSITMREQPELDEDPQILKTAVKAGRCVGVYASVERAGRVEAGQSFTVDAPSRSSLKDAANRLGASVKRQMLRVALPRK